MERKNKCFEKREGEVDLHSIFMETVAKAERFPGMKYSVDGDYIIKKKNINLEWRFTKRKFDCSCYKKTQIN
jgi:2-oxoglutarate dehydrogenase E2 component (dihydrolipoamide succinyltransferase)